MQASPCAPPQRQSLEASPLPSTQTSVPKSVLCTQPPPHPACHSSPSYVHTACHRKSHQLTTLSLLLLLCLPACLRCALQLPTISICPPERRLMPRTQSNQIHPPHPPTFHPLFHAPVALPPLFLPAFVPCPALIPCLHPAFATHAFAALLRVPCLPASYVHPRLAQMSASFSRSRLSEPLIPPFVLSPAE